MRQEDQQTAESYDYVVIGSGFGGSVSAMRLAEKGFRVLVLERGKRFRDQDFPRTNWDLRKFLWLPALRLFGIFEMSLFPGALVLHGSGVGGGSLVYANVLIEPEEAFFETPIWRDLADWRELLAPHYQTAKYMLGVTQNPRLWPADETLEEIAAELGRQATFRPTQVGVFFGEEEVEVEDPYFGGQGPRRSGCNHCGGCMVGCRFNAKNTLVKNYLYFAEKYGAEIRAESTVKMIQQVSDVQQNYEGTRYEVHYQSSTALFGGPTRVVRTRHVVVSAGVIGTLDLLMRCRDVYRTLPEISSRLGENVRTNSESLLGVINRGRGIDYSRGIAITSVFQADGVTHAEPVRYPKGSSFIRVLSSPLIDSGDWIITRILKTLWSILRHPVNFLSEKFGRHWAQRTTILLFMQTENNFMRMRHKQNLFTLFRRRITTERDAQHPIPAKIDIGHSVARQFAKKTSGIPIGSFNEGLFNIPTTAHIMGGCDIGQDPERGVVDLNFELHNYPGIYVVDGSVIPFNPGVNPSLTITALAEYALSRIQPRERL